MAEHRPGTGLAPWLTAGGITLDADAILVALKLDDLAGFLQNLVRRKTAAAIAARLNLSFGEDEIESALAEFYAERDLFEDDQIAAWTDVMKLKEAAVREFVREGLLIEGARNTLITDRDVNQRFASERYDYSRGEVEVYSFATAGEAREFILAVQEHELEPEQGERRELMRREAPQEIAAALFSSDPGQMLGPLESDEGSWEVYLLRKREDAALDENLREEIRTAMFDELVDAELAKDAPKFVS
jgi:hypothetical protein